MPSEQVSSGHIYHASARREQVSRHWLQYTGSCKSNYYTITTTTAPDKINIFWFGFVVLNVTFNTISVIPWSSVYWWRKPEYPEKTIDLSQVTDNRLIWENVINYKIIYPSLYNQSYMYHVFYKFIQMSWNILTKRCLTCKGWQHYSHIIIRYISLLTFVWFVFILYLHFVNP
jgi:hypothetical protein